MAFFGSLQNSEFTDWILGSESIWMYPTILTLHTMGLAVLVGASSVLQLRVLGVGKGVPVERLRSLYSLVWPSFFVNLVSGFILFVTQAADRVTQPLFYMKLGSIVAALWIGQVAKRDLFDRPDGSSTPPRLTRMAIGALALWCAAILTGRLMAYYTGS